MAEYIEREALLDSICHETCRIAFCGATYCAFMAEVCSAPAADVAPVVRCKDCKNSCKDGTGRTCEGYWYKLSEFAVSVEDDDFCSYGERKPSADG